MKLCGHVVCCAVLVMVDEICGLMATPAQKWISPEVCGCVGISLDEGPSAEIAFAEGSPVGIVLAEGGEALCKLESSRLTLAKRGFVWGHPLQAKSRRAHPLQARSQQMGPSASEIRAENRGWGDGIGP